MDHPSKSGKYLSSGSFLKKSNIWILDTSSRRGQHVLSGYFLEQGFGFMASARNPMFACICIQARACSHLSELPIFSMRRRQRLPASSAPRAAIHVAAMMKAAVPIRISCERATQKWIYLGFLQWGGISPAKPYVASLWENNEEHIAQHR